jgi:hypothetical protein
MDAVHKFEKTVGEWLKPLPHLPTEWRKWIADNVWWIILVGVILSVLGAITMLTSMFTATTVISNEYAVLNSLGAVVSIHDWVWYVSLIVSFIFLVITIFINAVAITPLKEKKARGWDLLFLTFIVSIVSVVVGAVLNIASFSVIGSIIEGIIGLFISAYFLFEIRSYFK